jgi:8-oxo-dGTP pyrophosphatase MutT (NUDIX family)
MGFGAAALGAACAVLDPDGRVLLVRHTYGARNWELPGGGSIEGEDPRATAQRELLEETGLDIEPGPLTGIYYEVAHETGPFLHAVFRVNWTPGQTNPAPRSPEVDAAEFWPVTALPRPMSDFTADRIHDASLGGAVARTVPQRAWLPDRD